MIYIRRINTSRNKSSGTRNRKAKQTAKKKHTLLELKGGLDGVAGRGPIRLGGLKGLEDDLSTTTVLVVDQLLSVLALLLSRLAEELLETGEGLVDVAGPGREGEVDLGSLEFLADLLDGKGCSGVMDGWRKRGWERNG